jgi:PAS domain S-box-containing protein
MLFSKLQPRKEILQAILDHIPAMISLRDAAGHLSFVNKEWERVLGLPRNNQSLLDSLTQWFPDPDLCQQVANHVLAATGEWHDLRPQARDGRVLDVSCANIRLSDGTGICIAQDITTRKEAERRVEASERRFRALFEKSLDHITVVDPNGRVLHDSSSSTEQGLGYASNEIVGQLGFGFMHPDDLPRVREAFQRIAQTPGATASFELRFRHKDGSWRFLESIGTNLTHIEEIGGIVINSRDVTDRKLAERTLRESEERFRRLFEGAPVGMVIADAETRILRANGALCRMLGYDEAELLGRCTSDLTHPDDRDATMAAVRSLIAGEMPTDRREKRYLAKNGDTIWADLAVSLVRGDAAQPLYALGVIQNITERKQADKQLRASQERSRQLAAYVVEAREEERSRIAREIHDELGQVLTGLKMGLENLAADCSASRASRAEIGRQIARMSRIVRSSIGSVKKISAQLRPGILDQLGLAAAIEWQAHECESNTGIKCALEAMPASLILTAEQSTAVFRVFQEVLTNVARHAHASAIRVRLSAGPQWLTLSVKDNGVGMRKAKPDDPPSLGLLGMRERASLLGGTIQFKGVRGKGTTVTLRLPMAAPKSHAPV